MGLEQVDQIRLFFSFCRFFCYILIGILSIYLIVKKLGQILIWAKNLHLESLLLFLANDSGYLKIQFRETRPVTNLRLLTMPNPLEQYSAIVYYLLLSKYHYIRRILLKNGEIGEMVLTMLWGGS